MTKLEQIKQLVSALDDQDFRTFSAWFEEHLADLWDQQIERDAKAGKLDKLVEEARAEHRAGRTRPF